MNPIVFAIPVFLLTIVIEAWLAHRRGLAVYDAADAVTSLHLGVLSQVVGLFVKLGIYTAIYQHWRLASLPADSIWVWIGALLAYDFFYYWAHRMGHEVGVMWAAHVVHHSSEFYNLATALRQTSSGWVLGWLFYLPLALAGVPPMVLAGVGLIDLLYQYWVHTELVGRLGWLDRVLVTPSNHRVHHGQNDYCIDKNYGGILILWDRLFGTFVDERDGERIVYGVRKPLRSLNPVWANLHYYADMWHAMGTVRGLRAKLHVWFGPPGGWTGEPLAHFEIDSFEPYKPQTPPAMAGYGMLQFALLVPCVSYLIAVAPQLSLAAVILFGALIAASTLTVGALLEGSRAALRLEQLRTVALGLAAALLPQWFTFDAPAAMRGAVLIIMLGCTAWLEKNAKRGPEQATQPM